MRVTYPAEMRRKDCENASPNIPMSASTPDRDHTMPSRNLFKMLWWNALGKEAVFIVALRPTTNSRMC